MAESNFGNPSPQFGTVEYAPKPGTDVCKPCHQTIILVALGLLIHQIPGAGLVVR
jgi:hypothetical protein